MSEENKGGISAEMALLGSVSSAVNAAAERFVAERGRGFTSDKESWAELKDKIELAAKEDKKAEKLLKEMWEAISEQNGDAFAALMQELHRSARISALNWAITAVMAKIAVEHTDG